MNTKQTAALKLALEALKRQIKAIERMPIARYEKGSSVFAVPESAWIGLRSCVYDLHQALEQPEQEPVACPKCKGLGYYDEGHECDDGTMVGGNYVECEKCKQPEFIKHEVESAEDWSEWVCPDPKSYLMKCCDCGLVHEAQFGVVRYKSETEREDCEPVDDPNLQAVFRMRRSEQWSPKDTAYRPGGLAQPEQGPLLKCELGCVEVCKAREHGCASECPALPWQPAQHQEPVGSARCPRCWEPITPPQRKPLTDEQIANLLPDDDTPMSLGEAFVKFARLIEAAHGIK